MQKANAKTLTLMLIPVVALIALGVFFSQTTQKPRLVISKISIVPTGFTPKHKYDSSPDKRIKVLLQYNPSSLFDRFKNPAFKTFSSFDLMDEKGKAYSVNVTSVDYIKNIKGNQYEVAYSFALYQVLQQMPSSSKQVWIKTKISFPDGWTLPVSAIVYRRK